MTTSVFSSESDQAERAKCLGLIRQLPDSVINQIKAGEVVERPLSVVKELVENAIDADSTEIRIDLFDGGKSMIRVSDNGRGMSLVDASVALNRHATSKIETLSDLDHIATFGFRGEALASISAVSDFSLRTRRADDPVGTLVTVSGEGQRDVKPVPSPVGTQVEVIELFCNTPARRKFLKSAATEFAHIHEFLQGMALAYPHVGFSFSHNRRSVFEFRPAIDLESRASALLGQARQEFFPVSFEKGSFSLTGFAGRPNYAKNVPQHFLLFVNGRLVRDRVLRAGVLQAYSGMVMKGLLPSVILFVQCDPSWVDVNAHPNKTEVRFCDPLVIQDFVCLGITGDLRRHVQASSMPLSVNPSLPLANTDVPRAGGMQSFTVPGFGVRDGKSFQSMRETVGARIDDEFVREINQSSPPAVIKQGRAPDSMRHIDPGKGAVSFQDTVLIEEADSHSEKIFSDEYLALCHEPLRYLGQFEKLYLLFESRLPKSGGAELWIVDQHAFHERILYEGLIKADGGRVARQSLITPHFVTLPAGVGEILNEQSELLLELGFECEWLPNLDKIALHAFPAFLEAARLGAVFDEVVVRVLGVLDSRFDFDHPLLARVRSVREDWLSEGRHFSTLRNEDVYQLMYATMACHAAVRGGQELSPDQVRFLIDRARGVDFSAHCPHGRPVIRRVSLAELSGWFART